MRFCQKQDGVGAWLGPRVRDGGSFLERPQSRGLGAAGYATMGVRQRPSWCAGFCINFVLVRRLLRQLCLDAKIVASARFWFGGTAMIIIRCCSVVSIAGRLSAECPILDTSRTSHCAHGRPYCYQHSRSGTLSCQAPVA